MKIKPSVSVIGLGYIGLPTAAILARAGCYVNGCDTNSKVVETISNGKIHIVEAGLEEIVQTSVSNLHLTVSIAPKPADVFIIAVPTPFKENHEPDLRHVYSAAKSIAPYIQKGNLIILESTSPVGTTEQLCEWLSNERPDLLFPNRLNNDANVNIAYCPERVLPGNTISELISNDRVIGGLSENCSAAARSFYEIFITGKCLVTNARTAEMCKLTENSFRDVNIAFANELSLICDELEIDVWELIKLANYHPRVKILKPGPGVGGHCIAVDPWFIVSKTPKYAKLIKTAREVNDNKPQTVINRVLSCAERLSNPIIACLGLSFKADVDDLRESPAVQIVSRISDLVSSRVIVCEPHIKTLPSELSKYSNLEMTNLDDAIKLADVIVLLVDHREFYSINSNLLKGKTIIDTRGVWR